jgi:hypothetical protein
MSIPIGQPENVPAASYEVLLGIFNSSSHLLWKVMVGVCGGGEREAQDGASRPRGKPQHLKGLYGAPGRQWAGNEDRGWDLWCCDLSPSVGVPAAAG